MNAQTRPVSPARRRRWPWWVAGGLLFMVGLPVALAAWLLLTEAGLRAAARAAEWASDGRIVVEAPAGRLAESVRIGVLRVETAELRLRIDDFVLAWRPARLVDRHVEIDELAFGAIVFSARPSDEEATGVAPPPPLELPLSFAVRSLTIGRLSLHDWVEAPARHAAEPFFELRDFSTALASDRRIHRVDALAVSLPFGELTLTADIDGGELPFALSARGTLVGVHDDRDYDIAYTATGNLLELQLLLEARGIGLSGDAALDLAPFEHVPLRRLRAAIGEIDPSAFVAGAPHGALTVTAELVSESRDEWRLTGPLRIDNHAPGTVDQGGIPLVSLDALLHWSPQAAVAERLALVLPGDGTLVGSLDWRPDASGASLGRLTAALELAGIPLQRLDARLPAALVAGRIDAEGDDGEQHARIDVRIGAARVRAEGEFRRAGGAAGEPVFAATGALSAFNPAALSPAAPQAELNLTFDAQGAFGELPSLTLAWVFEPSSLEGLALDGRGAVVVEGERLADADVAVTLAGNRLAARGAWGQAQDALAIDIDAPALAALGYGLGGRARIEAMLSGTRQEPAGTLRLFAEQLVLPGDVRVDGLNASGRLEAGLDGPVEMSLGASGLGSTDGETWLQSATLVVSGRRSAHRIDVAVATPDEDSLQLRLEGALLEGSTAAGDGARWRGMLAQLQADGRFPVALTAPTGLAVSRQRIALDAARLDAGERGRIRLDETLWTPERIVVRGALTGFVVELAQHDARSPTHRPPRREGEPLTFGAEWDLRLGEMANGALRVFREAGDFALTGDLTTRVGLEHVEARVNAVDNRLALSLDARGTELGTIAASASVLAERGPEGAWRLAPDAALLGSARFDMPSIAWLARMLDEEVVLGGGLSGDFSLSGTPANPLATGRIGGRELALSLVEHGLQLTGGALQAEFDRDRLRLARLEFLSPNRVRPPDPRVPVTRYTRTPGRLLVTGEIALDSGEGAFRFEADRLPILQRTDRWLILSGDGEASSTWTSLALNAAFRADAGYVELADTPPPTLSDDVVILGRDDAPREGGLKVSADVAVSLGNELYLSALGLDTRLTGELRLRWRDGEPLSAVGTIATAGGVFRGYGQNLSIERGLINFQGALDNPGLNVVALRKGLPVEAGISVLGSARRPQIRLVSVPNVPDPDKLSWIVLGRAPAAGGGADLGLLLPAAQALLGGSGGGMTEQLSRSLGFDEFGIGTGELGATTRAPTSRVVGDGALVTGEGTVSGQVLTLGKRLSTDLFLSFEQSLGGAESLVKLTYQLSNRVSVVARGGSDNSADVYYTVSFR